MKITPINPLKLAWPDWISKGAKAFQEQQQTKHPPKKTMEPTQTMEAQPEAAPVINHPPAADELTCDQCGQSGFRNALGLSMHKARLRGDARHPAEGTKPRPPSMDPLVRREYARKRYIRVKRERERQKSLALASAAATTPRRVRPEEDHRVEVGDIREHPRACPRCGMDLEAVTAAMNLRRK